MNDNSLSASLPSSRLPAWRRLRGAMPVFALCAALGLWGADRLAGRHELTTIASSMLEARFVQFGMPRTNGSGGEKPETLELEALNEYQHDRVQPIPPRAMSIGEIFVRGGQ